MSSSSRTSLTTTSLGAAELNSAKRIISQAISIGVPAYNNGDIAKCADVYEEAAKKITTLLPESLKKNLEESMKTLSDTDIDAKAWALRRQFDAIVEFQPPFLPVESNNATTFETFTKQQLPNPVGVMDNVMGGISEGGWMAERNTFFGQTSLENNGGFSSLRWKFTNIQNWSYAKGIYLKIKHSKPEQHTFQLILKDKNCERVGFANYKSVFANPNSIDEPILLPFSAFNQMERMGNSLNGSPPLNPSIVTEIGIMAIKPSVIGNFELKVEEWGLYL
eukprot:CAMPEP_0194153348 /NCGR_PEP_ID=MMETSP0152-20130528/56137_1 /TAXON_ID=1049557 /ORGANISM="Thalassiothrix antarctica, Strain L6-D1" /LENGTH=277 /DNA_ID=CAMNT_0038858581 /DNA_START=163 /DNA_END=996 /DNA_ORIENTATION=-